MTTDRDIAEELIRSVDINNELRAAHRPLTVVDEHRTAELRDMLEGRPPRHHAPRVSDGARARVTRRETHGGGRPRGASLSAASRAGAA
jgi:hypothetical protein